MSHELDDRINEHNEVTGKAMFYTKRRSGDTPWHRLGTSFASAPTLDVALEAAGHNFTVEKKPIYVCGGPEPGSLGYKYNEIEGQKATVRTDRNDVLGIVSDRYTVLQNREAFSVLEPMLDAQTAYLDTGGTLRDGQDVWMLVRFEPSEIAKRVAISGGLFDEIEPYGLIWNNHAGRSTVMLLETPVRVVCANTLAIALGNKSTHSAKVRHTGNVAENVKTAADLVFGRMAHRFSMFDMQRTLLMQAPMSQTQFTEIISDPIVKVHMFRQAWESRIREFGSAHPKTTRAEKAFVRAKDREETLRTLWHHGLGHTGNGSAWEAYNGLTQALDHGELFQRASKTQAARLRRQQETVKQQALRRTLKFASVHTTKAVTRDQQKMLDALKL